MFAHHACSEREMLMATLERILKTAKPLSSLNFVQRHFTWEAMFVLHYQEEPFLGFPQGLKVTFFALPLLGMGS